MFKNIFQMICHFLALVITAGSVLSTIVVEVILLIWSISVLGDGVIHFEIGKILVGVMLCSFHWIGPLLLLCLLMTFVVLLALFGGETFD